MLRRALAAIVSILPILGVGLLIPAGREFLKTIFWDRVLQAMNPYIAVPIGSIIEHGLKYGLPAVFGLAALALLMPEYTRAASDWARRKLNWYLVSAGVLLLASITAVGLYFWDKSLGPINWVTSTGSPLSFSMRAGGPLYFSGFQIIGNSRVDEPIRVQEAYVRSDDTHKTLQLTFAGVVGAPAEPRSVTIEPLGNIILVGLLPPDNPAGPFQDVSLETLRREFGRFTFVFKYGDGQVIERPFSRPVVERLIAEAEQHHRSLLQKKPGVIVTP